MLKSGRMRIWDVFTALMQVLIRYAQRTDPKVTGDTIFTKLNANAREHFGTALEVLQQGDSLLKLGNLGPALMAYLNAFEMVMDAKCEYGSNPERAF